MEETLRETVEGVGQRGVGVGGEGGGDEIMRNRATQTSGR